MLKAVIGLINRLRHRTRKRTDPLPRPFPRTWQHVLEDEVPFFRRLPDQQDRVQLQRDVYWFVTDRTWTAAGIDIDDRKKIVVAAFACLLLNRRLDLEVYPLTREIILRPRVFVYNADSLDGAGDIVERDDHRIGEAWYRGPVVLAWDAIQPLTTAVAPDGNVVVHEFAHLLDDLDGLADGTPPLPDVKVRQRWTAVFTAELRRLQRCVDRGRDSIIDPYGASDPAEFFAAATEQFFTRPRLLQQHHPRLYEQLVGFFRHDPATFL